jgi:membrane-bound lytic murein transglycosylase D
MLAIWNIIRNPLLFIYLLFSFLLFPTIVSALPSKNNFPSFPSIENNITFWENIYDKYSDDTAVLHDREDLSIIYTVTPLLDSDLPGSSRVNKAYLEVVKNKYSAMLKKFAAGGKPTTVDEIRIFSFFNPPDLEKKFGEAEKNLRIQTGLKNRFIEGVVRSGAYIFEMRRIFRSYNLPEDLAYLAHVESSFHPKAYSKLGAAGVWQFTQATGKDLMTINYILDERLDIIAATHAAARYLKRNYENLGTWPLAITAYNYGRAGMMRAVAQEGNYENIFNNYQEGHFKFASKNFYAEFLAARNIAKKLERADYIQRDSPRSVVHLKLPGYVTATDISNHFQLNKAELQELNPSLLHPIWQGEKYIPKGFPLRLPGNSEIIALSKNMPKKMFMPKQKRSQYYKVRRGDTASAIAHRFDIPLKKLIKINKLNKNAVVYVGQKLRIPSSSRQSSRKDVGDNFDTSKYYEYIIPVLQEKKKATTS